jgi:hypothetical protein
MGAFSSSIPRAGGLWYTALSYDYTRLECGRDARVVRTKVPLILISSKDACCSAARRWCCDQNLLSTFLCSWIHTFAALGYFSAIYCTVLL